MHGNGCVAVKDKLLSALRDITPDTCLNEVERVLSVLEVTFGFFCECEYEYKGGEIAVACLRHADDAERETHHPKRLARITSIKRRCWALQDAFHDAKNARYAEQREFYDKMQTQLLGWEHVSEYAA
jgi:hypothetical protein